MKLSHVCFKSKDINECKEFYTRVFSVRVIHQFFSKEGMLYGYLFRLPGGGEIEVFKDNNVKANDEKHFCIQVKDIINFFQMDYNFDIVKEVFRGRTDNVLQAMIRDPDGNLIEIQQIDQNVSYSEL